MPSNNYQPRRGGLAQTNTNANWIFATSGDFALLAQNNAAQAASNEYVGGITAYDVTGKDITNQAQKMLLALGQKNFFTASTVVVYQPAATPSIWMPQIVDYTATLLAQQALVAANGWSA
jgi:hypothetical protein